MLDKQPDVSRLIDRLVQKSLASRTVCLEDRRKMDILITDSGLKLLESMEVDVKAFGDWANHLADDEVLQLNTLLDKLRG